MVGIRPQSHCHMPWAAAQSFESFGLFALHWCQLSVLGHPVPSQISKSVLALIKDSSAQVEQPTFIVPTLPHVNQGLEVH